MRSVIIVVAHPDDEVLGCGGTGAALASQGVAVRTCVLVGEAAARKAHPGEVELRDDMLRAHEMLGFEEPVIGSFPNIKLNTVPHIELVEFIESVIEECQADTVFTHHPSDLNDDHFYVSRACQAAARLYQRRPGIPALEALHFMEILSSTEWSFPMARDPFRATTYFDVRNTIETKISALEQYRGVMRPYPHPRSREAIMAQATLRGAEAGRGLCEAFQTVFKLME